MKTTAMSTIKIKPTIKKMKRAAQKVGQKEKLMTQTPNRGRRKKKRQQSERKKQ